MGLDLEVLGKNLTAVNLMIMERYNNHSIFFLSLTIFERFVSMVTEIWKE